MKKVIIIGFDGFTWKTLDYLKGKVRMENLEKLREQSAWGILESTTPPITIPAWISFMTGCNPGKHGVFNFLKPRKNFDDLVPICSKDIKTPTFAQLLRKNGKKSIWINLPASTPSLSEDITLGHFIGSHDDVITPKELKNIPEVTRYKACCESYPDKHSKEYIEEILDVSKRRFETAKKLFTMEWDCFFVLFSSSDWIQHLAYNQIKSGKYEKHEDELLNIYNALDDYLGWFMENKDEDTGLILMSDHGFTTYEYGFSINDFLHEHGYLAMKEGQRYNSKITEEMYKKDKKTKFNLNIGWFMAQLKHFPSIYNLLVQIYMFVRIHIPIKKFVRLGGYSKVPDAKNSEAISPTNETFGIYINKERYGGTVGEHDIFVKEHLMELLKEEKSPFTGESPFAEIISSSEEYHGKYLQDAPDIIMKIKDHAVNLSSPTGNKYYRFTRNYHDYNGIVLINGNGVKPSELPAKSIMDLLPTALHMLGLSIPKYVDGKPILDAFNEDSEIRLREVRYHDEMPDRRLSEKLSVLKKELNGDKK